MLGPILTSRTREQVLLFLQARNEGYAREIARFFGAGLDSVQKQLERLEAGGVIYGRVLGRTHLFAFNPRYPFLPEMQALLAKALTFLDGPERERLMMNRRRPRRRSKPL